MNPHTRRLACSLLLGLGCASESAVFTDGTPEELALAATLSQQYLEPRLDDLGLASLQELSVGGVTVDSSSMAHTTLRQLYQGIPVFGGEVSVHLSPDGSLSSITETLVELAGELDPTPALTAEEVASLVLQDPSCVECSTALPRAELWVVQQPGEDLLAYRVSFEASEIPAFFLNASTGEKLQPSGSMSFTPYSGSLGAGLEELLTNGGFEESSASPWVLSGNGAVYSINADNPHAGKSCLKLGINNSASGSAYQEVTIPSDAATANLSFWLNVTTSEFSTFDNDLLWVEVYSVSGAYLSTLGYFSNLNKSGYAHSPKSFSLLAYKGQTVRVAFSVSNDSVYPTTFRVDDVSVTESDFTLSVSPASQTISRNGTGTYTVTASSPNGSTGTLALSASWLPPGVTASFSPTSISAGQSSTLTLNVGSAAATGTRTFTISGIGFAAVSTPTIYTLRSKYSGLLMDVNGFSADNGGKVLVWHWWGGDNQKFEKLDRGNGYYSFKVLHSGKCLAIESTDSNLLGDPMVQWDCNGAQSQEFKLADAGGGYYNLKPRSSGLSIKAAGQTDGDSIVQWWGGDGDTESWEINPADDFLISAPQAPQTILWGNSGTYAISSALTNGNAQNVTLSVSGLPSGVTASFSATTVVTNQSSTLTVNVGSAVQPGTYTLTINGAANPPRQATVTLVVPSLYSLQAKHSGMYMDVENVSLNNGARLHQWSWWGGNNQKFTLDHVGGGYYTLKAKHSGRVLDVSGASTQNGAFIQQWGYGGGINQQFKLSDAGDGYFTLKAKHSNKCIDVSGVSLSEGAYLHQWTCNGADNQKWKLTPL